MVTLLNTIDYDGPGDTPLLIAHGLFGSARNWNVIAKRLSDSRLVLSADLRNHGASFHDPDHSYAALAADLAALIEARGGQADVLGHSMGGKAAMVLALTRPELVRTLIVADIAPVRYTHTQAPVVEAMQAVDLGAVSRRSDADAQLARHIDAAPLRAFLLQSLSVGPDGAEWRLNLPALADQMPEIMGFPDLPGGTFEGPAIFIRGGNSDYVADDHLPAIRALFPQANVETVAGAGHWLHAEDPRGFEAALRAALA